MTDLSSSRIIRFFRQDGAATNIRLALTKETKVVNILDSPLK
jgi:hypothetical protein